MEQAQLFNDIITFLDTHWQASLTIIAVLGVFVQIAPVKVYPFNWFIKLLTKFLKWCGQQINEEVITKVDQLEKNLEEEQKQRDFNRIKDLRWQILDFGNAIKSRDYNHEEYDHIFEIHEEYDALIKKYKKTNGQVTRAMHRIWEKYHELEFHEDF